MINIRWCPMVIWFLSSNISFHFSLYVFVVFWRKNRKQLSRNQQIPLFSLMFVISVVDIRNILCQNYKGSYSIELKMMNHFIMSPKIAFWKLNLNSILKWLVFFCSFFVFVFFFSIEIVVDFYPVVLPLVF